MELHHVLILSIILSLVLTIFVGFLCAALMVKHSHVIDLDSRLIDAQAKLDSLIIALQETDVEIEHMWVDSVKLKPRN